MSIVVNGTTLTNVVCNGINVKTVICNGAIVFGGSESSWVAKTGAFIDMTSNSAPSPFTVSIENSYGTHSVSSTNYWYAFDNDTGNTLTLECQKPSGSTQNAYVGIKCSFGKTIKVKTMTFDGISGWGTRGIQLRSGTSVVYEVTDSSIGSSTTFTVPSVICDSVVIYVRQTVQGNGSSITCGKFQITSWEELEGWTTKTGAIGYSEVSNEVNPHSTNLAGQTTVTFDSPIKVTSLQVYDGSKRVDLDSWCGSRLSMSGIDEAGNYVTLLYLYNVTGHATSTIPVNSDVAVKSVTWMWYTPDDTWRSYNVVANGFISVWQAQG